MFKWGKVESIQLIADTIIQGNTFKAGTTVKFNENGEAKQ